MQNYFFNITDRSISGVITLFFLTLFILSFTSCEAVFEKNISSDTLVVIIPTNNDTSLTNNVQFKWENVEGASHYKLQLVEPSFSNINSFILDTNIEYEEFFYTLNPGNYQFQIRAENSAYETPWTGPYNLVVDSVSELTNQTVPLISPTDYLYSNDANFTFSWQSLFAAEYYEFELRSGSDFNSSSTTLHAANSIYATSYSTPSGLFSTEGAYSWGVKAINQSSSSAFSERTLYIDLTVPNSPISVSPAHGTSFADTVVLKWNT
ncbi:MAG: hypothetical protein JNJ99_01135, partial [Crocinitomicaceae bacterium]|nr:hypothetical protein [Crocinitomicaceae bacterium]